MTIRVKLLRDFGRKTDPESDVKKFSRGSIYDFNDFHAVSLIEKGLASLVTLTPGAEKRKVPELKIKNFDGETKFLEQKARATARKYEDSWEQSAPWSDKPRLNEPRWSQPISFEALQSRSDRYTYAEVCAGLDWESWTKFYGERREHPQEKPPSGPPPMLKLYNLVKKYDLTFWEYVGVVLSFFCKEHRVRNPKHPKKSEAFSVDELLKAVYTMGGRKRNRRNIVRKVLIPSDLFRPVYSDEWKHPRNRLTGEGWSLAGTLFNPKFPASDPTGDVHRDAARAVAQILAKRGYLTLIGFHPTGGEPHADLIGVPPSELAEYPPEKARNCWDWDRSVVVQIEGEPNKATTNLVDTIDESRSFGFVTVYPVWRRRQWYKIELALRAKKVNVSPFYDLRTVFRDTEAVIQAVPLEMFSPLVQNKIEEREFGGSGRHHAYETALRVLHPNYDMPKIYGNEIRAREKVTGKYEYVGLATEGAKRVLGAGEDVSEIEIKTRARKVIENVQEVERKRRERQKRRIRKAGLKTT